MANFNTHVGVATTACTMAASVAANIGLLELIDAPWYIFIGVVGGMLPDIDADNSTPVKRLFMLLAVLSGMAVWMIFASYLSAPRLMMAAVTSFFVVRYPLFFLFQKTTVHRGVFHSLLAAVFFALLTICISHYFLHWNVLQSWLSGVFLLFGFFVHLCLDEVFSVDLANGRMKKSFGTAMKLFSYNDLPASSLLLLSAIALFLAAPPSSQLVRAWEQAEWTRLGVIDRKAVEMIRQTDLGSFKNEAHSRADKVDNAIWANIADALAGSDLIEIIRGAPADFSGNRAGTKCNESD